jgi:hypothetical protein
MTGHDGHHIMLSYLLGLLHEVEQATNSRL